MRHKLQYAIRRRDFLFDIIPVVWLETRKKSKKYERVKKERKGAD
jgi:hypothetical protein